MRQTIFFLSKLRSSGSWWWTEKSGVLQSMGRKESDTTEWLNWTEVYNYKLQQVRRRKCMLCWERNKGTLHRVCSQRRFLGKCQASPENGEIRGRMCSCCRAQSRMTHVTQLIEVSQCHFLQCSVFSRLSEYCYMPHEWRLQFDNLHITLNMPFLP